MLSELLTEIDGFVATYDEKRRGGNDQRSYRDAYISKLDDLLASNRFGDADGGEIRKRRDALDALRREAPEIGRSTTFG